MTDTSEYERVRREVVAEVAKKLRLLVRELHNQYKDTAAATVARYTDDLEWPKGSDGNLV